MPHKHSPSIDPFLGVQETREVLANAQENNFYAISSYRKAIEKILDGEVSTILQNQITHSLDEFRFLINYLKEKARDIKKLVQDDTLFEGMKMEQYEKSTKEKFKNYILETLGELEDKLGSISIEIETECNIINIYDDYQKLVKIFEKLFIINTDSPFVKKGICSFGNLENLNRYFLAEISLQNLGDLSNQKEKNNSLISSCFGGEKLYESIGQENCDDITPIYKLGENNYSLTYNSYFINQGILELKKELRYLKEKELKILLINYLSFISAQIEKPRIKKIKKLETLEENVIINEIIETITSDGELEILRLYHNFRNLLQKVGGIVESYKKLNFQRDDVLENIRYEEVTKEEIDKFTGKIKDGNPEESESLKDKIHKENIVVSFISSGKLDDFNQEEARNFTSYLKASNFNEERIYSVLVDYINIIKSQDKIVLRNAEKEKYLIELEKYIFELSLKFNSQENGERAFGRIPIQDFTDIVLDFLRKGKNEETEKNLMQNIKEKKEKLKEYLDGLMKQYDINQDIIFVIFLSKINKIEEIDTEQIIQRITKEAKKAVEERMKPSSEK